MMKIKGLSELRYAYGCGLVQIERTYAPYTHLVILGGTGGGER
jgi:hypothetical protein